MNENTNTSSVEFVRNCAFCGKVLEPSQPVAIATVRSRSSVARHFTAHASCLLQVLTPEAAAHFNLADIPLSSDRPPSGAVENPGT